MHTAEEVRVLARVVAGEYAGDTLPVKEALRSYADLLEKREAEQRELSAERQKYADLSLAYERTDAELSAAKAEAERLREALQEFVDRCDRGEVRSRYTVRRFREVLAATRKEEGNG